MCFARVGNSDLAPNRSERLAIITDSLNGLAEEVSSMRFTTSALLTTVAAALLASCSATNGPSLSSPAPNTGGSSFRIVNGRYVPVRRWVRLATLIPPQLRGTAARIFTQFGSPNTKEPEGGIYVSDNTQQIYGYAADNRRDRPPICYENGVGSSDGVAVDGKGDLMVSDGNDRLIFVFKGPHMCGKQLGSLNDVYGQPSDAASRNATTGTIAVANILDAGEPYGSISVCTFSGGCTSNLTNPNMDNSVAGVAMARNGDCWGSSYDARDAASLTYFKRCSGAGQAATGFKNVSYGGLDIDENGNIVSIDFEGGSTGQIWVYRGCNPACSVVGGPFPLHGNAASGHLNETSTEFVAADFANMEVDVYKYDVRRLTYQYSFNNDLSGSVELAGAAFNPRSRE
jgi:hypothetical protein